ncbi:hypothetical protein AALP_AA1G053400 [Arabis alpina]|uniref:Uncharacterized protein n=1 Tax=Arabis alpina TaxID=50452 RepID=A0A087HLA2_ARAAL|nr:hypothetical protein AALP_AA1G053400 [Arabis alpina]
MEKTMMKRNRFGPSLTSLRLALVDSIDEMAQLCSSRTKDRDVLISGFQTIGVMLKSVSGYQGDTPIESGLKSLEDTTKLLAKTYMEVAHELEPELFPYADKCLLHEEEANNNITSLEMVLLPLLF